MTDIKNSDSIEKIRKQLQLISKQKNIIDQIQQVLESWNYKSIRSVGIFIDDIERAVEDLITLLFDNDHCHNCKSLPDLIKAVVHFEIYDSVFSCLKNEHTNQDLHAYKAAKEFCKRNGTPKQLGPTFYNFIPNAAVVELSMISNKRTPMEKVKCLQTVYDYVFAEVKGALISVISKYSDKELEIPFIENREIFPIVKAVILKSKLFYLVSELDYIKTFGNDILDSHYDLKQLYQIFEKATEEILATNAVEVQSLNSELENNMTVCDTINFIESLNKETTLNNQNVLDEEKIRIAKLITSATTENLDKFS